VSTQEDLFYPVVELPDDVRYDRYRRLVGLDEVKELLRKQALLLADPVRLQAWAQQHHQGEPAALALFRDRAPLFVFGGDVGSGKTALAESFGCDLADALGVPVMLYRLRLTTRGSGLVGEMTTLLSQSFAHLQVEGRKARGQRGLKSAIVFVIDEADAVAQSRAAAQMHHEDRAGVDALLAGIDDLATEQVPVLVVLCTNRPEALDPALLRRAAATFTFSRPTIDQRRAVLQDALAGLRIDDVDLDKLVEVTGPSGDSPGYTFSDLTQRLVPGAVLRAFPDRPVTGELLLTLARETAATPRFEPS
jgi:SpoVK/Ycf46/Vps4 family AAA+-type ATPase